MTPEDMPAFPVQDCSKWQYHGMSLRDYFAAKVMQAACSFPATGDFEDYLRINAEVAYKAADAMLKARQPWTPEAQARPHRPAFVDDVFAMMATGLMPDAHEQTYLRAYIEALERDRADAERYRHLRGGIPRTTGRPKAGRIEIMQWEDRCEANVLKGEKLDAAIDAQIATGASLGDRGRG